MMLMKQIDADVRKIAACGLYCGACRKHLAGKCNGCRLNERAKWCKIRTCCMANGFDTCAECGHDVSDCRLFSNWIGRVFAFLSNSDRPACIRYIKEHGDRAFAEEMAKRKCQTIKRR